MLESIVSLVVLFHRLLLRVQGLAGPIKATGGKEPWVGTLCRRMGRSQFFANLSHALLLPFFRTPSLRCKLYICIYFDIFISYLCTP